MKTPDDLVLTKKRSLVRHSRESSLFGRDRTGIGLDAAFAGMTGFLFYAVGGKALVFWRAQSNEQHRSLHPTNILGW